jgi:hypothetical protein
VVGGQPGDFVDAQGAAAAGFGSQVEDEELAEGGVGVGVLGFLREKLLSFRM